MKYHYLYVYVHAYTQVQAVSAKPSVLNLSEHAAI